MDERPPAQVGLMKEGEGTQTLGAGVGEGRGWGGASLSASQTKCHKELGRRQQRRRLQLSFCSPGLGS